MTSALAEFSLYAAPLICTTDFLKQRCGDLVPLPTFTLKGLHVSKTKLCVYEENYLQTFSNCSYPLAETIFLDLFPNSQSISPFHCHTSYFFSLSPISILNLFIPPLSLLSFLL